MDITFIILAFLILYFATGMGLYGVHISSKDYEHIDFVECEEYRKQLETEFVENNNKLIARGMEPVLPNSSMYEAKPFFRTKNILKFGYLLFWPIIFVFFAMAFIICGIISFFND